MEKYALMAGAIARLGREGSATLGRRFDSCLPHVICFKCNKQLESAFEELSDDHLTPHRGLIFEATGNLGSQIFDPAERAPSLVVWICDDCIVEHKDQVKVRDYAVVRREVIWKDYDPEVVYW